MDSDYEFMVHLLMEEVNIAADEDEHLTILTCLLQVQEKSRQGRTQTRRFEFWEEEDQAKTNDGGLLHPIR